MSRRAVVAAVVTVALTAAAPAVAQAAHKSVTATGTGQARVHPKNRHRNSSIVAAVNAARKASIQRAVRNAHKLAHLYAKAGGLILGGVVSISDAQTSAFYGLGVGGEFGPFGFNRYCGTVSRRVGNTVKKVHLCIVPRFTLTSLVVTYSAS